MELMETVKRSGLQAAGVGQGRSGLTEQGTLWPLAVRMMWAGG